MFDNVYGHMLSLDQRVLWQRQYIGQLADVPERFTPSFLPHLAIFLRRTIQPVPLAPFLASLNNINNNNTNSTAVVGDDYHSTDNNVN
jgi:hypothetical protein